MGGFSPLARHSLCPTPLMVVQVWMWRLFLDDWLDFRDYLGIPEHPLHPTYYSLTSAANSGQTVDTAQDLATTNLPLAPPLLFGVTPSLAPPDRDKVWPSSVVLCGVWTLPLRPPDSRTWPELHSFTAARARGMSIMYVGFGSYDLDGKFDFEGVARLVCETAWAMGMGVVMQTDPGTVCDVLCE